MIESRYIYNKIIPFSGYKLMTVWPFIFIRSEYKGKLKPQDYTHEKIHLLQQEEMLILPFFIIYYLEYGVKLICTFDHRKAYRSISFEQEAYANENDASYLSNRKHYAWAKFVFKLKK